MTKRARKSPRTKARRVPSPDRRAARLPSLDPRTAAGREGGYPRRVPSLRSRPSATPPSRPADLGATRTTPSDLPVAPSYFSSDLPPDLDSRTPPAGEPPYT